MWTIAAVNKKFDGFAKRFVSHLHNFALFDRPLGSYNGLTDVHLAHFFSQPSRRSHLKAAKLITEDGFIIPEKNVKGELYLDEKKRRIYDVLARSILQNAVHKEGSWNKSLCNYLEDISKMSAVDKARKIMRRKSNKVASELFFGHPVSSNITLKNDIPVADAKHLNLYGDILIPSNSAPVGCFCSLDNRQKKEINPKRSVSAKLHSPYGIPLVLSGSYREQFLSDYMKTSKQKKRKRRKFNNSVGNASAGWRKVLPDKEIVNVSIPHNALKFSNCKITMIYHGHLLLSNFQKTFTQNILIKQQHCGGTPVIIYKGKISANELLSFFSLDHDGFFFSIIVFLNGIRELKLSSCCVFRYLPGRHLGGPNGTFSIKQVEGGKPCLKCQYEEYRNKAYKITSQELEHPIEDLMNKENLGMILSEVEDKNTGKTPSETDMPEEISEKSESIHEDDSQRIIESETAHEKVEEIDEEINDLQNEDIQEEISTVENIADEANDSLYEEEVHEKDDSNNSVSSENQSEISEKYVEEEKKYSYEMGTSSSEDEGNNQHIVTVSVHGSPGNS